MYLLNPILGKDWIVCVGAYCIRPTKSHDHRQMIDLPDTFWGVCNTPIPIPYRYLINMYLLNPIPVKDWMVRVGSYCIRSTNTHDHGQMIDPPGMCMGVCNTPQHIPDKYLINTYLLNPIPDKDWIVRVGAYCIRPTKSHDHGQMIDPPYTCWGVCNTHLHTRIKNLIPLWTMNLKPDTCWGVCNTPLPIRIKNLIPIYLMNLKPGTRWGVCNTPLPIRVKNLIPLYWMNLKLVRFLGVCLCDRLNHGEKHLKFV